MKKNGFQIGEIITRRFMIDDQGATMWSDPYKCKIVYIHPNGYFITCEFDLPGGKIRESYTLPLSRQTRGGRESK